MILNLIIKQLHFLLKNKNKENRPVKKDDENRNVISLESCRLF